MNRTSVITGIILIVIAIVLGAFGAHALKDKLSAAQLSSFEVGVRYQMYHGLALLSVGFAASQLKFSLKLFNRMIIIGTIAFCLSIYLLAMKDLVGIKLSFLGPITPIGGSVLIIAWIILLLKFIRSNPKQAV
ncbi:MAG: DUF423 domain-containing protein [Crocinitomicaceae bacterium]|nr:DUF423 domain-containing protein [Flavobacteriales bacterium]NQZ35255.1 DUF423 domain-containing protein [Crocinitomicaceae bacterium]